MYSDRGQSCRDEARRRAEDVAGSMDDEDGGSLQDVINCWPNLPFEIQRAILAITREFNDTNENV